jgi:EAL domain-containing protein (putative c-di-GMP-specific phosphodiesterase class I)
MPSLHSLRKLGVRVPLDDFGTGYSLLSYPRSFPFDKIKINRSFIMDLLSRKGAAAIIKTTLAEALGMETTAKGVENVEQLHILRDQGCSQIQGSYSAGLCRCRGREAVSCRKRRRRRPDSKARRSRLVTARRPYGWSAQAASSHP